MRRVHGGGLTIGWVAMVCVGCGKAGEGYPDGWFPKIGGPEAIAEAQSPGVDNVTRQDKSTPDMETITVSDLAFDEVRDVPDGGCEVEVSERLKVSGCVSCHTNKSMLMALAPPMKKEEETGGG